MQAIIYDGTPTPVVADVAYPEVHPGEVLLKVARAGICGTDLSILSGKHPRARPSLVLGHEIAATVEAVGPGVERPDLAADIPVTVEPIISCGSCVACRTGVPHVCQNLRLYGIDLPGGMAEYMTVAADRVIPVDPDMALDTVVLAEPVAVAVHAVRLSAMRYGDSVCIIGGGPIGILTAIIAREATPGVVIVSEPLAARRSVAEELGFDVVDPTSDSLEEYALERTGGRGADVAFECAGSRPAVRSATAVLAPRGTLVQVSIPKELRPISLVDITFKEITIVGVRVYEPFDFDLGLDLLSRRSSIFDPLCSDPHPLSRAADAFDAARAGDRGLRIIFGVGA